MNLQKCRSFFLENNFNKFIELEKKLEKIDSTTEKGDLFEYFNYAYFCINKNKYQIKDVYDFDSIPSSLKKEYNLKPQSGRERGCDGMVIHTNGTKFSYQTKFYKSRKISSKDLMTSYQVGQRLAGWYVFSNVHNISHEFFKDRQKKPRCILQSDLANLDDVFFKNLMLFVQNEKLIEHKLEPRPYQTDAVNDICKGFETANKGKFISACGTGKTITSLLIKEKLKSKKTLFVVPSIYLVKQTIDEWLRYRSEDFEFLCVVSSFSPDRDDDRYDIDLSELGTFYTTDVEKIKTFLEIDKPIVLLSTYDSLPQVLKASKSIEFDLTFIDEAHRTAGVGKKKYQACFDVRTKKKLFMTATPRVLKPIAKESAEIENLDFFSMDNEDDYGEVLHSFSFRAAIDEKVIADYEILIETYDNDLNRLKLENYSLVDSKKYINLDLIIAGGIKKLLEIPLLNKILVFTNTIDSATRKSEALSYLMPSDKYFIDSISSRKTDSARKDIMSEFKSSKEAVLSNARCLTEGVDVPDVDCVVFAERRQSVIDIVQAVGRCLRIPKKRNNKVAKIFIPIIIDKEDKKYNRAKFLHVFEIIEAIKAHDKNLEDEIDKINIEAGGGGGGGGGGPIKIKSYHQDIDIQKITQDLKLEIAKLNSGKIVIYKGELGEEKIVSSKTRFNIVRMQFDGWKKLIDRGINIFSKDEMKKSKVKEKYKEIHGKEIDNNLIPYAYRAGIIKDYTNNLISLTDEGANYVKDNTHENWMSVISKHLKRNNNITWYPYNFCLKILKIVKDINEVEFLWGIDICEDASDNSLKKCCERINYIKNQQKDISIIRSNKEHSIDYVNNLNDHFSDQFEFIGGTKVKVAIFLKIGKKDFGYLALQMELLFNDSVKYDKDKSKMILI